MYSPQLNIGISIISVEVILILLAQTFPNNEMIKSKNDTIISKNEHGCK